MTAEEYFHQSANYADELGNVLVITESAFLQFADLKEQYTTKRLAELKDEVLLVLDHLVANEWNISGGGITRIKELIATLKASQ